jgi:hypothetical protein
MNEKKILAIGIFLLLIGIILSGLPFVNISKTHTAPSEVSSQYFQVQDFEVSLEHSVYHTVSFDEGQFVNIKFSAFSYGTEILLVVSSNSTEYLMYHGLNGTDENFTAPVSANYTFNYQIPHFSTETVQCDLLVTTFWNTTISCGVLHLYPVLRFEFLYLGVGFAVIGMILIVYGVVRKGKKHQQTLDSYQGTTFN